MNYFLSIVEAFNFPVRYIAIYTVYSFHVPLTKYSLEGFVKYSLEGFTPKKSINFTSDPCSFVLFWRKPMNIVIVFILFFSLLVFFAGGKEAQIREILAGVNDL